MMKGSTFTVNITVSQNWIDDGFDLATDQHQKALKDAILEHMLGYAQESEVKVKTVKVKTNK